MKLFLCIVVSSLWICSGLRKLSGNGKYQTNSGMLGADELCVTFHNYDTHWEYKLERHLFSLGDPTFAPDSK